MVVDWKRAHQEEKIRSAGVSRSNTQTQQNTNTHRNGDILGIIMPITHIPP